MHKFVQKYKKLLIMVTFRKIIIEEITLEEMTEDLNLMVIEQNLKILFQTVKIFKEKFQEEIIIMPQN